MDKCGCGNSLLRDDELMFVAETHDIHVDADLGPVCADWFNQLTNGKTDDNCGFGDHEEITDPENSSFMGNDDSFLMRLPLSQDMSTDLPSVEKLKVGWSPAIAIKPEHMKRLAASLGVNDSGPSWSESMATPTLDRSLPPVDCLKKYSEKKLSKTSRALFSTTITPIKGVDSSCENSPLSSTQKFTHETEFTHKTESCENVNIGVNIDTEKSENYQPQDDVIIAMDNPLDKQHTSEIINKNINLDSTSLADASIEEVLSIFFSPPGSSIRKRKRALNSSRKRKIDHNESELISLDCRDSDVNLTGCNSCDGFSKSDRSGVDGGGYLKSILSSKKSHLKHNKRVRFSQNLDIITDISDVSTLCETTVELNGLDCDQSVSFEQRGKNDTNDKVKFNVNQEKDSLPRTNLLADTNTVVTNNMVVKENLQSCFINVKSDVVNSTCVRELKPNNVLLTINSEDIVMSAKDRYSKTNSTNESKLNVTESSSNDDMFSQVSPTVLQSMVTICDVSNEVNSAETNLNKNSNDCLPIKVSQKKLSFSERMSLHSENENDDKMKTLSSAETSHSNRSSSSNGVPDVIFANTKQFINTSDNSVSVNSSVMQCSNDSKLVDTYQSSTNSIDVGDINPNKPSNCKTPTSSNQSTHEETPKSRSRLSRNKKKRSFLYPTSSQINSSRPDSVFSFRTSDTSNGETVNQPMNVIQSAIVTANDTTTMNSSIQGIVTNTLEAKDATVKCSTNDMISLPVSGIEPRKSAVPLKCRPMRRPAAAIKKFTDVFKEHKVSNSTSISPLPQSFTSSRNLNIKSSNQAPTNHCNNEVLVKNANQNSTQRVAAACSDKNRKEGSVKVFNENETNVQKVMENDDENKIVTEVNEIKSLPYPDACGSKSRMKLISDREKNNKIQENKLEKITVKSSLKDNVLGNDVKSAIIEKNSSNLLERQESKSIDKAISRSDSVEGFGGFKSASGNKININSNNLNKFSKLLELDCEMVDVNGILDSSKQWDKLGKTTTEQVESNSTENVCGFKSAAGIQMKINPAKLDKFKKMLELDTDIADMSEIVKPVLQENCFTSTEKNILSDKLNYLDKFKHLFDDEYDDYKIDKPTIDDVGKKRKSLENLPQGFRPFKSPRIVKKSEPNSVISDRSEDDSTKSMHEQRDMNNSVDATSTTNVETSVQSNKLTVKEVLGESKSSNESTSINNRTAERIRSRSSSDEFDSSIPDDQLCAEAFCLSQGYKLQKNTSELDTHDQEVKDCNMEKRTLDPIHTKAVSKQYDVTENCMDVQEQQKVLSNINVIYDQESPRASTSKKDPENLASNLKMCGFKTASGNNVTFDNASLKFAKLLFDDDDPDTKENDVMTNNVKLNNDLNINDCRSLFKTASGNNIKVDRKCLEAARKLFSDNDSKSDFGTSHNIDQHMGDVKVNETRLKQNLMHIVDSNKDGSFCENTRPTDSGFKTASGKDVIISDTSLEQVRQQWKEDSICDEENMGMDGSSSETVNSKRMFKTAAGRSVEVTKESLDYVHNLFQEDDVLSEDIGTRQNLMDDNFVYDIQDKSNLKFNNNLFKTASGQGVNISKQAVESARKTLGEGDSHDLSPENKADNNMEYDCMFKTVFNSVPVSEKSLNEVRQIRNDGDTTENGLGAFSKKREYEDFGPPSENCINKNDFMFTSASGKSVNISENALEIARKTLGYEDFSTGNSGHGETKSMGRPMFTSASGKSCVSSVNVSEKSLIAVRKALGDDKFHDPMGESKHEIKKGNNSMFTTASGNAVNIAELALNAARERLGDDMDTAKLTNDTSNRDRSLFTSASGKSVIVSEEALKTARKTLGDDEYFEKVSMEDLSVNKGGCMFTSASGKAVKISNKALEAARKTLGNDDFDKAMSVSENIKRNEFGSMFSSASGKAVNISEKALEAARKTLGNYDFEMEPLHEDVIQRKCSSMFSSASGKSVIVSEKALQAARKTLGDTDFVTENVSEIANKKGSSMFSSASGKSVNVSEKALQAARKTLGDANFVTENVSDIASNKRSSMFSSASGRSVNVSEKALQAARKTLGDTDFVTEYVSETTSKKGSSMFSSASGKPVTVSEKALEAARKTLGDNNFDNSDVSDMTKKDSCMFSSASGKSVEISEKALEAARKTLGSDHIEIANVSDDITRSKNSYVFSSASGKSVNMSEKALASARMILSDSDFDNVSALKTTNEKDGYLIDNASGKSVNVSEKAERKAVDDFESRYLRESATEKRGCSLFSSASGKTVNISEAALKAARKTLRGDDVIEASSFTDCITEKKSIGIFSSASGKAINISESALEAARKALYDDDVQTNSSGETTNKSTNGMFMSAKGDQVNVSKESVDFVRQNVFSEFEVDKVSSVSEAGDSKQIEQEKLDPEGRLLEKVEKVTHKEEGKRGMNERRDRFVPMVSDPSYELSNCVRAEKRMSLPNRRVNVPIYSSPQATFEDRSFKRGRRFTPVTSDCTTRFSKTSDITTPSKDCSNSTISSTTTSVFRTPFRSDTTNNNRTPTCSNDHQPRDSKNDDVKIKSDPFNPFHYRNKNRQSTETTSNKNISSHNAIVCNPEVDHTLWDNDEFNLENFTYSTTREIRNNNQTHSDGMICKSDNDLHRIYQDKTKCDKFSNLLPQTKIQTDTTKLTRIGITTSPNSTCNKTYIQSRSSLIPTTSTNCDTSFNNLHKNISSNTELSKSPQYTQTNKLKDDRMTPNMRPKCDQNVEESKQISAEKNKQSQRSIETNINELQQAEFTDKTNILQSLDSLPRYSRNSTNKSGESETTELHTNQSHHPTPEDLTTSLEASRMEQDKIIRNKKKQQIRPSAGRLLTLKSGVPRERRVRLKDARTGERRVSYTQSELHSMGIHNNTLCVTSANVATFTFDLYSLYTPTLIYDNGGVIVGDNIRLVPHDNGSAGSEQFHRALCTHSHVDPKLIDQKWTSNHFRWIVWKLAAYEVSLPHQFAGRSLTADNVMSQLKYRYDREIDLAQRSCIKKITERDDAAGKRMVLCVSNIMGLSGLPAIAGDKSEAISQACMELTDGWYSIPCCGDQFLHHLISSNKVNIGDKLCIQGAEVIGLADACSPLDFMEKLVNGGSVFRNVKAETKAADVYNQQQQKNLETMYTRVSSEIQDTQNNKKRRRSTRQSLTKKSMESLQSGKEIYDAMNESNEPESLLMLLSSEQHRLLESHQRMESDRERSQVEGLIRKRMAGAKDEFPPRKVTPLQKVRVTGCGGKDVDSKNSCLLTIWRPDPGIAEVIQEGKRLKISTLSASYSRSSISRGAVQLTATKNTRFQPLDIDENLLDLVYEPRETLLVRDIPKHVSAFKELDFVGVVLKVVPTQKPNSNLEMVYAGDSDGQIIGIRFWTGLKAMNIEETLLPNKPFSACNLLLKQTRAFPLISLDVSPEITTFSQSGSSTILQQLKHLREVYEETFFQSSITKLDKILGVYSPATQSHSHSFTGTPAKRETDDLLPPPTTPDLSDRQIEQKQRSDTKRHKLQQYSAPPPLPPFTSPLTKAVRRSFQPPRKL